MTRWTNPPFPPPKQMIDTSWLSQESVLHPTAPRRERPRGKVVALGALASLSQSCSSPRSLDCSSNGICPELRRGITSSAASCQPASGSSDRNRSPKLPTRRTTAAAVPMRNERKERLADSQTCAPIIMLVFNSAGTGVDPRACSPQRGRILAPHPASGEVPGRDRPGGGLWSFADHRRLRLGVGKHLK